MRYVDHVRFRSIHNHLTLTILTQVEVAMVAEMEETEAEAAEMVVQGVGAAGAVEAGVCPCFNSFKPRYSS